MKVFDLTKVCDLCRFIFNLFKSTMSSNEVVRDEAGNEVRPALMPAPWEVSETVLV